MSRRHTSEMLKDQVVEFGNDALAAGRYTDLDYVRARASAGAYGVFPARAAGLSLAHLVHAAEEELRRRRMREKFLPRELFGEGAWTILLDLFVSEYRGRKVSVTSACHAADVPATTALRWLELLQAKGLITRTQVPTDRRVRHLWLTDKARSALIELLARQAA